jgi:hypothetical protein
MFMHDICQGNCILRRDILTLAVLSVCPDKNCVFTLTRIYTIWLNVAIILALLSMFIDIICLVFPIRIHIFRQILFFSSSSDAWTSSAATRKMAIYLFLLLVILAILLSSLCIYEQNGAHFDCVEGYFFCLFKLSVLNFSWNCKCLLFRETTREIEFFLLLESRVENSF